MSKVIKISAKCSDLFSASLYDGNKEIGHEYDGYVPNFFPGEHYDYVTLNIDIETGKILNWKKPTNNDLVSVFGAAPKLVKNVKHIPSEHETNLWEQLRGSVTVKGKQYASINDLTKDRSFKLKNGNNSHLKLKRDENGKFIKMDDIAEFVYPHNGSYQYRRIKVIDKSDDYVEGIQLNHNTGYKRFLTSKISGIFEYKAYAKDIK